MNCCAGGENIGIGCGQLFDSDGFGQVAGFVGIKAAGQGQFVS